MKIDGRCHCGFITYEAEIDPEKVGLCHCTDCQTPTGTAFRIFALTHGDGFRLLSGEPKIYVKTAESSQRRLQAFCPECGSPIYSTSEGEGPKIYSIRVGTSRQRRELAPRRQIWCRSTLPWMADLGSIPRNEKQEELRL
jgi:hypothetical protein